MTDLRCTHCRYEWEYSGQLMTATCPSCKGSVPVKKGRV